MAAAVLFAVDLAVVLAFAAAPHFAVALAFAVDISAAAPDVFVVGSWELAKRFGGIP